LLRSKPPSYSRAINGSGLAWQVIPNLGRTLGAVTAFPQGADDYPA